MEYLYIIYVNNTQLMVLIGCRRNGTSAPDLGVTPESMGALDRGQREWEGRCLRRSPGGSKGADDRWSVWCDACVEETDPG